MVASTPCASATIVSVGYSPVAPAKTVFAALNDANYSIEQTRLTKRDGGTGQEKTTKPGRHSKLDQPKLRTSARFGLSEGRSNEHFQTWQRLLVSLSVQRGAHPKEHKTGQPPHRPPD